MQSYCVAHSLISFAQSNVLRDSSICMSSSHPCLSLITIHYMDNYISLYGYATICLSIHQLKNIEVASSFWSLKIKL